MAHSRRVKHAREEAHAEEDRASMEARTTPAIPQLQLLRFLQLSLGTNLVGYTESELGLEIPVKIHHVSKGSSRKDCPYGYRVRTCNQCSPGLRIDLGTYAHVQDALLVNDAWQLLFGDPGKLQLLKASDRDWLHLIFVRRFLRRTSQVVSLSEILGGFGVAGEDADEMVTTRNTNKQPMLKRTRTADSITASLGVASAFHLDELLNAPSKSGHAPEEEMMVAHVPMAETRFMVVNHAESLLAQFSYVENTIFAVMRMGYDSNERGRVDGQRMLSMLLRHHSHELNSDSALEVYKSPASALHRVYASLVRKVLSSLVTHAHTPWSRSEASQRLDLGITLKSWNEPPAKAGRPVDTTQLFRDIMDHRDCDPFSYLEQVEVFAMNILADGFLLLCEEVGPHSTDSPVMDDEELRQRLAQVFEMKVMHEQQIRSCTLVVLSMLSAESRGDPMLIGKINQSLVKLRTAYISAAINLFSFETRIFAPWEADARDRIVYASEMVWIVPTVAGERLQHYPPRIAGLLSDHRVGGLVSKAWDDFRRGIPPNMMVVDAAVLDSISRRYAIYGGLGVNSSHFDHSDHPAESEIQALTPLLQYLYLRSMVGPRPRPAEIDRQSYVTLAPVDFDALRNCTDDGLYDDAITFLYPEFTKGYVLQLIQQDLEWYLSFCRAEGASALFPSAIRAVYLLFCLLTYICDDVAPSLRHHLINGCKQLIDINRQTSQYASVLARKMGELQESIGHIQAQSYDRDPQAQFPQQASSSSAATVPMTVTARMVEQYIYDDSFDQFFNLVEGDNFFVEGMPSDL